MSKFRALVVEKSADEKFTRRVMERSTDALPAGDVLVDVRYSSLNYKDGLVGDRQSRRYAQLPAHAGHRRGRYRARERVHAVQGGRRSHRHRFRPGHEHVGRIRPANSRARGLGRAAPGGSRTRRKHDPRYRGIHRGVGDRQARSIRHAVRQWACTSDWCHRWCRLGCGDAARAPRIRSCRRNGEGFPARLSQGARCERDPRSRCAHRGRRTVRCSRSVGVVWSIRSAATSCSTR